MWQGIVESLHIVAEKSQPMATVETIRAVPGRGLEGDRYANGKADIKAGRIPDGKAHEQNTDQTQDQTGFHRSLHSSS